MLELVNKLPPGGSGAGASGEPAAIFSAFDETVAADFAAQLAHTLEASLHAHGQRTALTRARGELEARRTGAWTHTHTT